MQASRTTKGKAKAFTYERDIICLPKSFQKKGCIKIPRGQDTRQFLAQNRLIGKISLSSSMNEEICDEIASVFSDAMGGDLDFPFTILQPAGGASKSLVVPSLSSSFRWTASTVAGKNAKVPIYILAERDLKVYSLACKSAMNLYIL